MVFDKKRTNNYPHIFKFKVIEFYKKQKREMKIKEILSLFSISNGSLYRWIKLYEKNELTEKKKYTKSSKYTPSIKCFIRWYATKYCNFDYKKLIVALKKKYLIEASKSSIYEILKNMRITRKKIRKRVIIKNEIDHNKKKAKFIEKIKNIPKNKIISIDETSFDTHIDSLYGWSLQGKRIIKTKKLCRLRYTIISAISNKKIIYNEIIRKSANSQHFLKFIKKVIELLGNEKYYFLLDNARIHHAVIVKNYIGETNCEFLFNVPYSPELNPIELVFSKVKNLVRKKNNNINKNKLIFNLKNAFKKIRQKDLKNFYKHSLN